jgi:Ca-activated chloride channel family protein
LILLTDGINNAGRIPPLAAAEAAATLDIKVYTIGAGTRGEAPIPGVDPFGRKRLMLTRVDIDEQTLKEVAELTGAMYFRATDTASLEKVYAEIDSLEATTRTIKKFDNYRELYPYLLALVLSFLGFEMLLIKRRVP